MTDGILERLQGIKKRLGKSIQDKSVIRLSVYDNMVEVIKESVELIDKGYSQKEEILKELGDIYKKLIGAYGLIQEDCWDSYQHSLSNNEPLSDKYDIKAAYKNLSTIVEILELLQNNDGCETVINDSTTIPFSDIKSLQKKMKEALEKMQQQQPSQSVAS